MAANCKFKTTKFLTCQKIGDLARVCMARSKRKGLTQVGTKKLNDVHQLETTDISQESSSSGSEEGCLHTI